MGEASFRLNGTSVRLRSTITKTKQLGEGSELLSPQDGLRDTEGE